MGTDTPINEDPQARQNLANTYNTLSTNLNDVAGQFNTAFNTAASGGQWQSPAFDGSRAGSAAVGTSAAGATLTDLSSTIQNWQQHMSDSLSNISTAVMNQGTNMQNADQNYNGTSPTFPGGPGVPPIGPGPNPPGGPGNPPGGPNPLGGPGVGPGGPGVGPGGPGGIGFPGLGGPVNFPQPHDMGDLAREIIRNQNGKSGVLLLTRFGQHSQNNWLVTIPDMGNNNATQDPGDPGAKAAASTNAQGTGLPVQGNLGGANSAMTPPPTTPGATTSAANVSLDAYLNNTQNTNIEFKGQMSPYGQFVAQAIQQYCSPKPPDQATSPLHPAMLWLAGHGLGGMVAQNLAATTPFPGDNPGVGPAHIVRNVIAFGAPVVGKYNKNVAYDLYEMKGDRVGDISVDMGINDARKQDIHELQNPFTSPPWQSTNPNAPDYVKNPTDPTTIHGGYADSDQLTKTKLPFTIGAVWGPTYAVPIPMAGGATNPVTGAPGTHVAAMHSAGGMNMGAIGVLGATALVGGGAAAVAYAMSSDKDDEGDDDDNKKKKK